MYFIFTDGGLFCFLIDNIFAGLVFSLAVCKKIYEYAEDERACDGGYRYLAECEGKTADTCDEYSGSHEEISVIVEVERLEHLETRYRDEAVECDAHTAHYTGGDSGKEGYKGSEE